jgi:uncharacterized membrane protein
MSKKVLEMNNGSARSSTASEKTTPESPEWLTKQNVQAISKLEAAAKEQRTPVDRIAQAVANFCGSMTFVWVHVLWFGSWIALNTFPGIPHIDPFPFTFLTLVVSLEAIFLSTFILISQNHETRMSERRNHLDLQINLLTEQENTVMLTMLQAIAVKVGADISHNPRTAALAKETEPEKLVEQIEQHQES